MVVNAKGRKAAQNGAFRPECLQMSNLVAPSTGVNVVLSLLHPLNRYIIPSAIGSAIGRPYLASTHR